MLVIGRLDASMTPSQLRDVFVAQPHRALEVAIHPACDEPFRQWLWRFGNAQFREAVHKYYLQQRSQLLQAGLPLPASAVRYDEAFSQMTALDNSDLSVRSGEPGGDVDSAKTVLVRGSLARLGLPDGTVVDLVSETVVIGRKPSASRYPGAQLVMISDPSRRLSSSHAMLARAEEGWHITDLHSGNGTVLGLAPRLVQAHPGITYRVPDHFVLAGQPVQLLIG